MGTRQHDQEREPLLRDGRLDAGEGGDARDIVTVSFSSKDSEDPRQWSRSKKLVNLGIIAQMALLSPLASSMISPGISQIAEDLGTTKQLVIGCTTVYVVALGISPLFLAPMSEVYGRRPLYLWCYAAFSLLQIPCALAPNIATLLAMRTLTGLFGAVGIANGGGTISDMFDSSERARFMGLYILGVITGPSIGSVGGGFIVQRSNWRWLFWILLMISAINTILGFFFLHESFAPVLLNRKKEKLEAESDSTKSYRFEGQDDKPLKARLLHSLKRPFLILSQPIVLVMSAYQALLFGTMYSIYTEMESIFSKGYGFSTEEVGLLYLGSGLGFVTAILILVPYIDVVHKALGKRHGIDPVPEFRLPLANIGALLVPTCLFIFFWTVQYKIHWVVPIMATYFYGLGQVMILNCTQNYFIDAFEQYAASAIAAATLLRMVVGGCAPLVSAVIFKKLGLGVGGSIYGGLALALSPAPLLFYKYGGAIREKYKVDL